MTRRFRFCSRRSIRSRPERRTSTTPTPFSTSATRCASPAGPRRQFPSSSSGSRSRTRRLPSNRNSSSPGRPPESDSGDGLLEDLLGNVEVRVNLVDVVVLLEGVQQSHEGAGGPLVDLDGALWLHRKVKRFDLDA